MNSKIKIIDNTAIISILGPLKAEDEKEFEILITEAAEKNNIILDLEKVPYIHSYCLSVLYRTKVVCNNNDISFSLASVSADIMNMLNITHMHSEFKIYESVHSRFV